MYITMSQQLELPHQNSIRTKTRIFGLTTVPSLILQEGLGGIAWNKIYCRTEGVLLEEFGMRGRGLELKSTSKMQGPARWSEENKWSSLEKQETDFPKT